MHTRICSIEESLKKLPIILLTKAQYYVVQTHSYLDLSH